MLHQQRILYRGDAIYDHESRSLFGYPWEVRYVVIDNMCMRRHPKVYLVHNRHHEASKINAIGIMLEKVGTSLASNIPLKKRKWDQDKSTNSC